MTDTTITPTPQPELTPQPGAAPQDTLDAAIAAAAAPEPANTPAPASEPSLADLEKLSDAEIDKMLTEGTKPVETPAAAPAPAAAQPASTVEGGGSQAATGAEADDVITPNADGTVPLARLNQEIQKRKKVEQEREQLLQDRAYLAGKNDAVTAATKEPEPDAEAVIAFNLQKLNENYNENVEKLAKKFDDGECTLVEYEKQKQALSATFNKYHDTFTGQLQKVKEAKAAPDPEKLQAQVDNHAGLKAHTAKIEADNPWMKNIPPALEGPMTDAAVELLAKHNIFLPRNPTVQDMVDYTADIRLAMVDVARAWGFDKIPSGAAPATTTAPQAPGTPKADPSQIQSKLALAKQQPPHTTVAGAALPTDALQALQPEQRSADELSKLKPQEIDALIERESRAARVA